MSFTKSDVSKWVEEHGDYLLNFAMSKLNQRDLALDLIQDTYISAIAGIDRFEGRSSPRTWLTSILNRKIIDHWRKKKSRKTNVVSHYFSGEGSQDSGNWILENVPESTLDTIETKVVLEEQLSALEDCIDVLPDKSQGVIRAKYVEQKKGDEICKEYDITSSNFWVLVHRAKLLLRNCLQSKV
jgi:RNA polymerase sigma-70 factor (ECF subfamily)